MAISRAAPSSPHGRALGDGRAPPRPERAAVVAALIAAGFSVAAHVLGKAVRDALYLATFPVEALPYFMIGTGLVSGILVSLYTRLMAAWTPRRVVPAIAAGSALTLALFYVLVRSGSPAAVAVLYVFTTVTGPLVVSGFWGVLGERFDPRTARQLVGLVGAASTGGGLVGGLGAHSLLRVMGIEELLLPLGAVNLIVALALVRLGRPPAGEAGAAPARQPARGGEAAPSEGGLRAGMRHVLASSYLRDVALLVVATTVASALADYILKDAASRSLQGKQQLAEFFSLFHGAVGAITLAVQVFLCRPLVARKGLAAALIALPAWFGVGAAMVIVAPVLWAATALRAGENAVRNSFHRAGYELLFAPLSPQVRRITKPILDTLLERLADGLGAALVLLLVTVLGMPAIRLAWPILALSVTCMWLVIQVRRGYVSTLSASLAARAVELEEVIHAADDDATAREALRSTLLDVRQSELRASMEKSELGLSLMRSIHIEMPQGLEALRRVQAAAPKKEGGTASAEVRSSSVPPMSPPRVLIEDPVMGMLRQLSDPDPATARAAMRRWDGRDRRAVPFLVRLLSREELHRDATAVLSRAGDRVAGALSDHLTDLDEDFAVRRRIPRVLSACRSPVAVDALVRALSDRRFEVRYHAASALERIQAGGGPKAPADPVWATIREEVRKSRTMWEAQRLLDEDTREDGPGPDSSSEPGLATVMEQRGAHSLRHVFRLLGLVLDPKPLELCYQAIGAEDPQFRAVSLEYLENVLPADVKAALWPLIGDDVKLPPVNRTGRSLDEVMKELSMTGVNMSLTMDGHPVSPAAAAALKEGGAALSSRKV